MANPVLITCTANTWVKVATAVKIGTVHRITNKTAIYLQTYRLTGEAAPVSKNEGAELFSLGESEAISNTVDIDVYIYCIGVDGKVRVDV